MRRPGQLRLDAGGRLLELAVLLVPHRAEVAQVGVRDLRADGVDHPVLEHVQLLALEALRALDEALGHEEGLEAVALAPQEALDGLAGGPGHVVHEGGVLLAYGEHLSLLNISLRK